MNTLFKFCHQTIIYFLPLILWAQGIATNLNEASPSSYETIEHFVVEQKIDALLLLIQKRLVIMHEVARTKWNQNLPIEDHTREQQILALLGAKAHLYGLDEKFVIQFFQAQMDAAKEIQKRDFSFWKEKGVVKFEKIFNLKDDLRLYIDQLNQEMLALLGQIYANPSRLKSLPILEYPISTRSSDYIENESWVIAISPLKND